MDAMGIKALADGLRGNISRVIVGKEEVVDKVLAALLAGGHVLLEDVPGTGKTLLSRALARSLDGRFSRIQFTPDLLPGDVTGMAVFSPKTAEFTFKPGPVFANVVLADEINRATPRAQSSMLECMEEKQVSCDGTTYPLPQPFFVIATQNPVETQGTFPLPEAQLDRFMVKLSMGYPTADEQALILARFRDDAPQETLAPVADAEQLRQAQRAVRQVRVHEDLLRYIGAICEKTRALDDVLLGASPRAALALMRVSQACAAMDGRNFVTPEDVKRMAVPALAHRMILRTAYGQRSRAAEAVQQALDSVPVPTEKTDR
ncbi:MAG: AAA family ATPase [Candidatus Spyradocola sp.]